MKWKGERDMNEDEILKKVAAAADRVGIPSFTIDRTMDNTPEWDSLKHLQFLSAIEHGFGTQLGFEETIRMTSARLIVEILKKHLEKLKKRKEGKKESMKEGKNVRTLKKKKAHHE